MDQSQQSQITVDDLTYNWPPPIENYETKLFNFLTLTEAIATTMGFMIPIGVFRLHLAVGAVGALILFLLVRKFERFGHLSLPLYLVKRVQAHWQDQIELPLIASDETGMVEMKSFEGDPIMVME